MKCMLSTHLHLWGEDMDVLSSEEVKVEKDHFALYHVRASDDTKALLPLCDIELNEDCDNLEAVITQRLQARGLKPHYIERKGHRFLASVSPIKASLAKKFGAQNIGIVVLLDGEEPGEGVHALEEMRGKSGSVLQVLYRIAKETNVKMKNVL